MTNRVSNEQLDELLDYLIDHPNLVKGIRLGVRSKDNIDKQWNYLASKLNSYGSGSSKSGERWKKYWADLKHKSKSRVAKQRQDAKRSGSNHDDLSEVDKKILTIINQNRAPNFTTKLNETSNEASTTIGLRDTPLPFSTTNTLPGDVTGSSPSPSTSYTVKHDLEEEMSTERNVSEPIKIEAQSPVSRQRSERHGLRRSRRRSTIANSDSSIEPEWVIDVERRRVDAESRLADAAMIMAEASRMQATAARAQADALNTLVQVLREQQEETRALLLLVRDQCGRDEITEDKK